MEANHKKRMREAVGRARAKILNNSSAGGTNNAVPDLLFPSPMSEYFNDKKTGMMGV